MLRKVTLEESYWTRNTEPDMLETTLGDLLRALACEVPERVALLEANPEGTRRQWTYLALLNSAERTAQALLSLFNPGERIAIWSPNSAEWILLQHGAAMAGLVLVTVNPAYQADELKFVLAASQATGVVHAGEYRGTNMGAVVEGIRGSLPLLRESLSLSELGDLVVATQQEAPEPLPVVQPGDMIQIQFTSGTTGKPKGACLHHRGVVNAARFAARRAGFAIGGTWASAMPLFHVGGCAGSELGAMSARGTFVLQTAFDAGGMLEAIEREGVNHLHAVPTMLVAMLEHPRVGSTDLSSLKTVMSGGSPVPASLVQRIRETFGCKFTITFGQTELNGVICQTHPDDSPDLVATTIGQPAPHMEVKIADPSTGAIKPLGQPGEIWARGYQTMLGYFSGTQGSETVLSDDGWLRTGDQASMDGDGYLRITGRLKDCVIRGGENIYPREVEDALLAHPSVQQVAVVGVPDEKWGEAVTAVIRFKPGLTPPAALDLHHHCRARLAPYKTPSQWYYVDEYPTTSSGKIQKFALRTQIIKGELRAQPFAKPKRLQSDAVQQSKEEQQLETPVQMAADGRPT